MIDGGSTTLQMCQHLAGLNLQVLTNSLHIVTLQASFFLGFALLGPLVVKISNQQANLNCLYSLTKSLILTV